MDFCGFNGIIYTESLACAIIYTESLAHDI